MGERLDMACRICGDYAVDLFLDLGDQPHCNRLIPPEMTAKAEPRFPLRAGFCQTCSLVQIDHTIPKESMFSDYPYLSGTTRTLVDHFRATAARLVSTYDLKSGALVVDIGSNDGTWLEQYAPFGLAVQGVEPAANVAELASDAGIETENRFFNKETAELILERRGKASLITAAGVFFHLEELHSVVDGVGKLLAEDGVFVVQAIYLGSMIENTAFDQIYHEHLCYYTLKSISALFERHGLECFDVRIVPIHGGSLEVHVGYPGRRSVQPSIAAMREAEARQRLDAFETYEGFAARVHQLKADLLALLERYRAGGRSVYAFGAPAKGATLLNSFGIDAHLVQRAVEKSPLKFGFLIPGARIPIVDEATSDPPAAFLLLAWNFLDEFIEKERLYLQRGGEFIVPVPSLRVLTSADLRDAAPWAVHG